MFGTPFQVPNYLYNQLDLGETIDDKQLEEIHNMYNYLTNTKKLSPRNASAIMGNVWQETRFDDSKISKKGATGFLQFLDDREEDYRQWLLDNPTASKKYGQFDYILYAINDIDNKHDLYRIGYEKSKENISKTKNVYEQAQGKNKQFRKKDYDNAINYHNTTYGKREKEGRLYFFEDLRNSLNNTDISIDQLTSLWHDTVERSNPKESRIDSRINAAKTIYNYFNK